MAHAMFAENKISCRPAASTDTWPRVLASAQSRWTATISAGDYIVRTVKGLRRYNGWSGLTPDGSPLFVRDVSNDEIYALDLELP